MLLHLLLVLWLLLVVLKRPLQVCRAQQKALHWLQHQQQLLVHLWA